jgi:carnosine N-methyltransferase
MNAESWDAVCTCFFIDTAVNVIEYIEAIWGMLKPGGVWVNFGTYIHFT